MAHWAEVTIHGAEGSGGDCDQSLLRTTGQRAASSCWGEMQEWRRRRARGCHMGRGETRYLSGSTERVQEEKLKRQQNSNRKSEEGLWSGGEGKQRGLGMATDPLAKAPMPSLSHAHAASGTGGEVSGGPAPTGVPTRVHTHAHTVHHAAGHMPTAPGTAPQTVPEAELSRTKVPAWWGGRGGVGQSLSPHLERQGAPCAQIHP